MTTEEKSPISLTTPNRVGKGVVLIVVLMGIGAGLHFAFSAEWNAYPPASQSAVGPVEGPTGPVTPTGVIHEFELRFVESADFRVLGFNALPGEEGANPDMVINVGDDVIIEAINDGNMPHAFGVVSDPDDPASIIFKSALNSVSDPLLRGADGEVKFIPDKEGEYYYICTIPGHSALGMKGKFIVKSPE